MVLSLSIKRYGILYIVYFIIIFLQNIVSVLFIAVLFIIEIVLAR